VSLRRSAAKDWAQKRAVWEETYLERETEEKEEEEREKKE
jgi:hypothetical protein